MPNAPDLHVHSGYSIYDGQGSPAGVVQRGVELGWDAIVLTEHGHMMSVPALYHEARAAGIKPIVGCEMYVCPEDALIDGDKTVLKERRHLTVLALSFDGYRNMVAWQKQSMERPAYYDGPRISMERMAEIAPHGLHHNVILSGCLGGELCQCILDSDTREQAGDVGRLYLESAANLFPNFYVELQNHAIGKWLDRGFTAYDDMLHSQEQSRDVLLDLAQELSIPVIVTNDSHYQSHEQRRAHIAMMARKQHRKSKESHERATTASTSDAFLPQYIYWGSYMREIEPIAETMPAWAAKQAIQSIREIVDAADVRLDPLDKRSYTFPRSAHDDPEAEIRRRSKGRLKLLASRHGDSVYEKFEYELSAMKQFAHYLLIYSDVIKMAREQGTYTWTRGSACGSIVTFCLRIHSIDPLHYGLLFERFVNPARSTFPDVDIDFEAHKRDDIARMVEEYMAELGQEVLHICNFTRAANRQAFRIVAEAEGIDKEKIDELVKLIPQMIDTGMATTDEEAFEILREEMGIDLHAQAAAIFDAPSGISQHACAYVIGTEERPLSDWVPPYLIGSSNGKVTQYNMKWIEALGYLKLDLLRLDTLSIMHSIARQLGKDMDWLDSLCQTDIGIYDEDDPDLFKMLSEGRTDGVFTFQGSTQRRGCLEVRPENTRDLVHIQGLYRPSGTRTGLDKTLVARRHGTEQWSHLNALTAEHWDETYGLPIFQEQVMQLGFSMGMSGAEVDDLYKAIKTAKGMGRGAAELFAAFEPTFRKYAEKLMSEEEADEIWRRFDALQGYTFNKIHATSFAILGRKSAKLKSDHPREHFVACLERFPDNPRYVAAARSEGFTFESPCINRSGGGFSRGTGKRGIRIGLLRVAGVGPGAASEIVRNQPFSSVEDLRERTNSSRVKAPTIEALAAVGALEDVGVQGDADDLEQLRLLSMVIGTPTAFAGCEPQLFTKGRSQWKFLGLDSTATFTEGKTFCAKLFWIPDNAQFATKASPNGSWQAHCLDAVDINGIPFDILVSDKKYSESLLIKHLATMKGSVVCVEGKIRAPFERGDNTAFSLWGVAGGEQGMPQMWHCTAADAKAVIQIHQAKREERRT